jgi:transporter family-2 protein
MWFFLLLALAAGIMMAFQGSINGAFSKVIGGWEATLIVHLTGLFLVLLCLFVFHLGRGDWQKIGHAPAHFYLGGLLNVVIIFAVMTAIAQAGAGKATTAILVGQLLCAMVINHFGWFGLEESPLTWGKGLGVVLLLLGGKLIIGK